VAQPYEQRKYPGAAGRPPKFWNVVVLQPVRWSPASGYGSGHNAWHWVLENPVTGSSPHAPGTPRRDTRSPSSS
jgi:hypothetical protein